MTTATASLAREAAALFAGEPVTLRPISPHDVVVAEWVRAKCQYGCLNYGKNLSCPPFAQDPAATERMLAGYDTAIWIVAETDYQVAEASWRVESFCFFHQCYRAFGMAAGPCKICHDCDLANGCRYPNRARPAMEALGIDVIATAERLGYTPRIVPPGEWCTQFFGLVLVA